MRRLHSGNNICQFLQYTLGKRSKAQLKWGTLPTGKFQKTTFQSLKSCFFDFPVQTPRDSRQWAFQVLFQLPKAQLQWETLPTGKFQKTTFQSLKSCFFDFPVQTPVIAGSELFRFFSSSPKRNCNGGPFQLANFKKKQLFRGCKVVFWFSPPDTRDSRQWAFQVLFQLPKAQLQWKTLTTGKFQKTIFESLAWKGVFWFSRPDTRDSRSELFRCFSSCPKRNCNGRPFQLANFKKQLSEPEKLFFDFPVQTPVIAGRFSGSFPAAQSAIAMGDPSSWQISKKQLSEPEKLFFDFPVQTPVIAGSELFKCFSSCPKRNCNGKPLQLANFKKQFLRAWPEKVFFDFPVQTPVIAGVSFSGAFPAAQSAIAMGDPSSWQISKKQFQRLKSCFLIFPSRHPW